MSSTQAQYGQTPYVPSTPYRHYPLVSKVVIAAIAHAPKPYGAP